MGEKRNFSKLEDALEIKSLRRIISAYLNYPDAAEEDVRRYERSYKKLSPTHKALLSHLPSKYNKLRRCISMNTYFIMNMLQAFEPPIDMSQDIDENENLENCHNGHHQTNTTQDLHDGSGICTVQSINGSKASEPEFSSLRGRSNVACDSFSSINEKEKQELYIGNSCKSTLSKEMLSACHSKSCNGCGDAGKINSPSRHWLDPSQQNTPLVDVDKVRCIIRNIVRDWAPEGQKERDQCYKPILEELNRLFPVGSKERPPCCLVPGAGLGRLALEISCLGFVTQGNEFSYYMMICSSFILNHTEIAGEWTIYPWIHNNCNSLSDNDQLRPVSFPDIHPASAGITEGFSMCGGDFVEVYSDECQEASWDVVVTCFFLDTAHNIVEYIEKISKIVKDGGVWINLGPLLYHFADAYGQEDEMSIELSLEDVKRIAFHYGFELEMEKIAETTYTANPRAMIQNCFFAAFWTMKRKPRA